MAFEQKPNTGALFKNNERTEDTHAHAKGTALIGGVTYYVSAWTNAKDDGTKWQKLTFKAKEERKPEPKPTARPFEDMDDDIPY